MPDWLRDRRSVVVQRLERHSEHVLMDDVHGHYRRNPKSRVQIEPFAEQVPLPAAARELRQLYSPCAPQQTEWMGSHPPELIHVAADLILRRPNSDDAEDMAAAVAASLEHLVPWMPWAAMPDVGAVATQHERLADVARAWDSGEEFNYLAATRDEGGAIVGRFGLHRRVGAGALELGYWLRPDAVGKGYASACTRTLTAVALSLPDVERVEIHCDAANARSQRVARTAGYRLDRIVVDGVQAPAEVGRSMIWVFPPNAGQATASP